MLFVFDICDLSLVLNLYVIPHKVILGDLPLFIIRSFIPHETVILFLNLNYCNAILEIKLYP